ncbi:Internalin-A precursor [Bythopirellula polymerisocia]|uniref:Internalin-A n=1 Tax=Bythopirellula polymerisocia TaxID=2528003 RepID=A0A5C6D2Z5_9BACT|nr:Internalin-A precursor [Bythopirellula polymerisocia]
MFLKALFAIAIAEGIGLAYLLIWYARLMGWLVPMAMVFGLILPLLAEWKVRSLALRFAQCRFRFGLRSLLTTFAIASVFLWFTTFAIHGLKYRERRAVRNLEAAGAEIDFVGMTSSWSESIWMALMLGSDSKVRQFHVRYRDVAPGTLQLLLQLPEVVDLRVGGSRLSDSDLRIISQLQNLRRLSVGNWNSTQISDNGVKWLSSLSNLHHLHLNAPGITDAGIEHLSGLSNLQSLSLTNTGVTDAALPQICRLRSLRTLGLMAPGITNTSMSKLQSLPELLALDIRGASISDAGLDDIAKCEHINTLYISKSQVSKSGPITPKGVQELRRRLPDLRIRN